MVEIDNLKAADVGLEESIGQLTAVVSENDPKSFPRFWVWYEGDVNSSIYNPLKFNRVQYNTGSIYSTSTGKVTIPVNGLYQFSVSLNKRAVSSLSVWWTIQINNSNHAHSYS